MTPEAHRRQYLHQALLSAGFSLYTALGSPLPGWLSIPLSLALAAMAGVQLTTWRLHAAAFPNLYAEPSSCDPPGPSALVGDPVATRHRARPDRTKVRT